MTYLAFLTKGINVTFSGDFQTLCHCFCQCSLSSLMDQPDSIHLSLLIAHNSNSQATPQTTFWQTEKNCHHHYCSLHVFQGIPFAFKSNDIKSGYLQMGGLLPSKHLDLCSQNHILSTIKTNIKVGLPNATSTCGWLF